MRFSAYLVILALAGSLSVAYQAKSDEPSPVGRWESVDYVQNVNNFQPGKRSTSIELFLKGVEFHGDGTTDSFFSWQNDWILHNDGKTKAQFYIKQMNNSAYLFLPWLSGDVTERGQKPWYYVLGKVPDNTQTNTAGAGSKTNNRQELMGKSFQTVRPVDSVNEYDDVRWKDLSKIKSTATAAVWPDTNIIPPAKKPDELLKIAMNPGLGIRQIHKQGITGKGINVAIIDQAMYLDHPEFSGKITAYHFLGGSNKSSMHGPSVTSLLVGNNCGTAPDANVYYVAARDGVYEVDYAEGLDWIVEQNRNLPASEKIRVVSVSAAPGLAGTPAEGNQKKWNAALARAQAEGILVLDCTPHNGFIGSCWLNSFNVEDVTLCTPGFPGQQSHGFTPDKLLAPTCPRTTAEQYNKNDFSYQYCGRGGLSWAIPYVAGVLAMGWQVNPDLTGDQMKRLLFDSAATTPAGAKIINPARFIAMVKATRGEQRRTTKPANSGRASGSGR
jgi:subtilisin family serine protease